MKFDGEAYVSELPNFEEKTCNEFPAKYFVAIIAILFTLKL